MAITQLNAPSAHQMFVEDIIADSSLGPELSDPNRILRTDVLAGS